ncbi:stage VI sporulation protein D [Alkalihalobacillus sp. AL-G]|uniref:stage VI sporulation protein D n=1 Tax=Alkalihalobacillus sp. AL-G TaxID=2926399 RepID=UPI00272B059F|nr:stage VI sporulation protein D [Alkalihalobacillus sp. AL-G]WLD92261.1 stage VI sporulation protein D [Alkalihalobacillus sp. AL-G]
MTEREQSSLNFSIEESVWLKKGQEVDELFTVALNPDVTIEESGDQVLIKGNLYLTGEYRPSATLNQDKSDGSNDQLTYRSFSQLSDSSEESVQLEHRFPVDVTIPKNRVPQMEDLYVTVDNFDYELPSPSCLEVSASVSISGIYESQSNDTTNDYTENYNSEDDTEFSEVPTNPFPILEFESRRKPEQATEDNPIEEKRVENREPSVEFASRSDEARYEQPKAYSSHFMRDAQPQFTNNFEEEETDFEMNNDEQYNYYEYEEDRADEHGENEYVEHAEVEYTDEDEPTSQKAPREENALYLTKMLTRDDEALTKLKMCITQAGDSLETIAGKYDVPTSQLVRVNRLDSEEIEEGQILYIPVSATR